MIKDAVFSLNGYRFNHVLINMDNIDADRTLNLEIFPKGTFLKERGEFMLDFMFTADSGSENVKRVIEVNCKAFFKLDNIHGLDDIPPFFYSNSIAILFPYVRAFISTLTLQANYAPILLPVKNLVSLADSLKQNITEE